MKSPVVALAIIVNVALITGVAMSCTAMQRTTMTGAFSACAKADLGALVVADGLPLEQDVANKIKGNASTLETDLGGLVTTVGLDAVLCAIAAVEAALAPATGSGSGMKVEAELPGLVRAKAWAKTQATKP